MLVIADASSVPLVPLTLPVTDPATLAKVSVPVTERLFATVSPTATSYKADPDTVNW